MRRWKTTALQQSILEDMLNGWVLRRWFDGKKEVWAHYLHKKGVGEKVVRGNSVYGLTTKAFVIDGGDNDYVLTQSGKEQAANPGNNVIL